MNWLDWAPPAARYSKEEPVDRRFAVRRKAMSEYTPPLNDIRYTMRELSALSGIISRFTESNTMGWLPGTDSKYTVESVMITGG